jgi:hypothetical protein
MNNAYPQIRAAIEDGPRVAGKAVTRENRRYLETKRAKLGHRLHHQDLRFEETADE